MGVGKWGRACYLVPRRRGVLRSLVPRRRAGKYIRSTHARTTRQVFELLRAPSLKNTVVAGRGRRVAVIQHGHRGVRPARRQCRVEHLTWHDIVIKNGRTMPFVKGASWTATYGSFNATSGPRGKTYAPQNDRNVKRVRWRLDAPSVRGAKIADAQNRRLAPRYHTQKLVGTKWARCKVRNARGAQPVIGPQHRRAGISSVRRPSRTSASSEHER